MSETANSTARQRIEALVDENSFVELGASVTSRNTDFNLSAKDTPSDGVVTGHGLIDGNLVYIYAQDASVLGGSIGEMHARKILSVYDMALKMGAPVIGLLDSTGVRLQESADALESIGAIIKKASDASGLVPQILGVFGSCGGGLSVLTTLSDFVYMAEDAKLFINAADCIGGCHNTGDTSTAKFRFEKSGQVDAIGSEADVLNDIRALIPVIPASNMTYTESDALTDDLNRAAEGLESKRNDIAAFATEISDGGLFIETKKGFAKDMTTGFIKLAGATVGIVGNNAPKDGERAVLTADGCDKAADFVRFCDAFELPILSVTNIEGYEATGCAERRLPRALARMIAAFAEADVARINLIAGKAYGSAYLMMNSKSMGADLVYAYPDAEDGIMDASLAAKIISADDASNIEKTADEFATKANGIDNAARRGYVDRFVNPADTRKYLIDGFEMLFTKSDLSGQKKHSTR